MNYNDILVKLKREIKYKTYLVQAEIRVQKPAGLFASVAELALVNSKLLTEDLIVKEFAFSIPMAKRVIQRCLFKGLIEVNGEDAYYLTTMGEDTANGKLMYEKESGEYRLYITDDPLIPQRVLTIQRIDKSYHLNRRNDIQMEKLGFSFEDLVFQNFLSEKHEQETSLINSDKILIENCHENIHQEKNPNIDFSITCTLNPLAIDFRIGSHYKIGGNSRRRDLTLFNPNSEFSFSLILSNLLKQRGIFSNWDEKNKILKVPFELQSKRYFNYKQFYEKLVYEIPKIESFGEFEKTSFQIPIAPQDSDECLKWEKYLLLEKINEICFNKQYLTLKKDCEELMKKKGKISVELPNQQNLAGELKKEVEIFDQKTQKINYGPRSDKYWFLQTGLDLEIEL
ncbi:MAG: hypothetical protein ACFFAO_14160 [Candidatus Hermodarchaeota archaeon]